jgi:hypothetical protein
MVPTYSPLLHSDGNIAFHHYPSSLSSQDLSGSVILKAGGRLATKSLKSASIASTSRYCTGSLRSWKWSDILAGQDQPKSHDEPTFATYLILRRGLGEIVAKVTEHFQLLSDPVQYRDVEAIDADFKENHNSSSSARQIPRQAHCHPKTCPDQSY